MKIKLLLAVFAMIAGPTLAFAECSGHGQQVTSSCKDGFIWDTGTQACVPGTNS